MYNASDVIGTDSQHPGLVPVIGSAPGTNGNTYASTPVDPAYVEGPSSDDYIKGVPPLETLPAQWWNWLNGEYTKRFNNMSKQNGVLDSLFKELNNVLTDHSSTPDSEKNNQLITAINKPYMQTFTGTDGSSFTIQANEIRHLKVFRNVSKNSSIELPVSDLTFGTVIFYNYDVGSMSYSSVNLGDKIIRVPSKGAVVLMLVTGHWNIIASNDVYNADKHYPAGSIYMNSDDSTNPRQLFGIGLWSKITDRFIASYGNLIVDQTGGNRSVTLSNNNVPRHNHPASFSGDSINGHFYTIVQDPVGVAQSGGGVGTPPNKAPFSDAYMENYGYIINPVVGTEGMVQTAKVVFDYKPQGSVTVLNNTNEVESFSIIPPYYAVHTWKRIE